MSITTEQAIEKINLFLTNSKASYDKAIHMEYFEAAEELKKYMEAEQMAIDALRDKADREDPKPLTIEELRLMNGEPVWVAELSELIGQTGWAMVEVDDRSTYKGTPYVKCSICTLDVTFGGLHCYRHKPKEE